MLAQVSSSSITLWLLLAAVVVILIAAAVIVLVLRRAKRAAEAEAAGVSDDSAESAELLSLLPSKSLALSFSRGMKILRAKADGRDSRYDVPWILMIGAEGSGTTAVLESAGHSLSTLAEGGPALGVQGGPEWWFYEDGLVLNAPEGLIVGPDNRGPSERGWFALLRQFVKHRPRRPIDGVILALSAKDLIYSSRPAPDRVSPLEKAEILRLKLAQLRRVFALRVPVHVLITNCGEVPGFSAFAAELPPPLRDSIFGWSNPYALDVAFSPAWVDVGFEVVLHQLVERQMEVYVERGEVADSDAVFQFPRELGRLREPLREQLERIFRDTAYEESCYFRGFYFCGSAEARPALGADAKELTTQFASGPLSRAAAGEPNSGSELSFLRELFGFKIMAECRLARPLSRIAFSRNRAVAAAQLGLAVFLVLALVGSTAAWVRLSNLTDRHLVPLLSELDAGLQAQKADTLADKPGDASWKVHRTQVMHNARGVLSSMGLLSSTRLRSVFLPSSFNSDIDARIESALAEGFRSSVLEALRLELSRRFDEIVTQPVPSATGALAPSETPEATLPYIALQRFSSDLRELEVQIAHYERIRRAGAGDLSDLKSLLTYVRMDDSLPQDFNYENPYFQSMLRAANGRPYNFDQARRAVEHARVLLGAFFANWFGNGNKFKVDVDSLVARVARLDRRSADVQFGDLHDAADGINLVSKDLNDPNYAWLSSPDLDAQIASRFRQSFDGVKNLADLDPTIEIDGAGRQAVAAFRHELADESTRLTGPVLNLDVAPVQTSDSVAALDANLNALQGQPFVMRDPGPPMRFEGGVVLWDRAALQEAQKLCDFYDRFDHGPLRAAPSSVRTLLRRVALARLQGNVLDIVGQAEKSGSARGDADREYQAFTQSLDVLTSLLSSFGKFESTTWRNRFSALLSDQAVRMLRVLDRQLQQESPYAVRDGGFNWWEGAKPLSLAAYDARSADELKDQLDDQRRRVQDLALKAEPLLKFLEPHTLMLQSDDAKVVVRWQATVNELKKHDGKKAGNSVSLLEDFVQTGLDKISTEDSCRSASREPPARQDFFFVQRSEIRDAALARCRTLAQRAYTLQLADFFNRRLAGRFPFSSTTPSNRLDELDPAVLAEFLRRVDEFGKAAAETLRQNASQNKARDQALSFLSQMDQVRAAFAPFVAGIDKDPAPSFDFAIEFRVNQDNEIGGNQIIDWAVDVGSQSYQVRGKETVGKWHSGDPIRVTLRFADDSPGIPVEDKAQREMQVRRRTVTYQYSGAWALLGLLVAHQASPAETDGSRNSKPQLLSFNIPITPDRTLPVNKDTSGQTQVRVYLRVSVLPSGGKEAIRFPVPFPSLAPALTGSVDGVNQASR